MPRTPVLVYIVGAGRSGSTLLERMLGSLTGFHNVGEMVEVFHRGVRADEDCACGTAFSECEFWQSVGKEAFGGWTSQMADDVDRARWQVQPRKYLLRTLADARRFRGPLSEYSTAFSPLPAAVANVVNAQVVVDASKLVTHAVALSASPDLDVRLLHLVRDSRGVAYSWTKSGVARPAANGSFTHMRTHAPSLSAARWVVDNTLAEAAGRRVSHYHRMRYEDLMIDPAGEVRRALAGLDIEVPPGSVAHLTGPSLDLAAGHALLGNPSGYGRPRVTLREDIGWHAGLSARDQRVVTALSAPMLLRYRYPTVRRKPHGTKNSPNRAPQQENQ